MKEEGFTLIEVVIAMAIFAIGILAVIGLQVQVISSNARSNIQTVLLEWTPCNFVGQRPWFRCPAVGCGKRVAVLYCGAIYACRHCHELAYKKISLFFRNG